jgi:putative transposase
MNPLEGEWYQLKAHEIAGQMFEDEFEDEFDLAVAVMDGMKARSLKGDDDLEHFIFNFA